LGVEITGTIEDSDGNTVADLTTKHLGMGIFALIPQSGKTYKAKIKGIGETVFTVDLPKALDKGYLLSINNTLDDSVFIKVAVNENLFNEQKNSVFYILAQSAGKVYFTSQGKLEGLVYTAKVDKARFPSGIAQFTLFSQVGEPVAERIAFINNPDTLKLNIATQDVKTYTTRQSVKINIDAKDGNDKPVAGSFSVTVTNESRIPSDENSEVTILNNLLLTSDLKGYIEQPNYYFNHLNEDAKADLDILMLTQGYRRFEWKPILDHKPQAINYLPEKSLEIDGSIKTPSGQPVVNGSVTLMSTKEKLLLDTTTDLNGDFKFKDLYLSDTSKIILRARKEHNGSNVTIYVKQPDYPPVPKSARVAGSFNDHIQTAILQKFATNQPKTDSLMAGRQLNQVTISAKKTYQHDELDNYGMTMEYDVNLKKLPSEFSNIKDIFTEIIPGVHLDLKKNIYVYEGAAPKIYIDGLERDSDALEYFSPKEIESMRMIAARGQEAPALLVTTKRSAGTDTTVLKQVTINAKKINKQTGVTESENLNGPGHADQVIMGDKLEGCITLSDCLNGKVFGVTFDNNGTPYSIRTQGRLTGPLPMVIILNGSILDGSHLNELDANTIASIEVLRSGAYLAVYGSNAPGGALVITTRSGGDAKYVTSESPSGIITYPFKGFYKARQFYSPKYDHGKNNSSNFDFRSAMYWNPNIITDKDGKASIEYFNADTKGIYRVELQGIDDNGNLGRQVFRYKVE